MTNQKDLIPFYGYSSKIKTLYDIYTISFFNFVMSNLFKMFSKIDDLNNYYENVD